MITKNQLTVERLILDFDDQEVKILSKGGIAFEGTVTQIDHTFLILESEEYIQYIFIDEILSIMKKKDAILQPILPKAFYSEIMT